MRFNILIAVLACISLCIAAYLNVYPEYVKTALYVFTPVSIILAFVYQKSNRRVEGALRQLLFLYLWIAFCVPFAQYPEKALPELYTITGCFLLCYSGCLLGQNRSLYPLLYLVPIVYLISMWIYAKDHLFSIITFGDQRLTDEVINSTTFGYFTFYSTFSIYIIGEISSGLIKQIAKIAFFTIPPISFLTGMYTGSRQVLVIEIPLFCFLMYVRYKEVFLRNKTMVITIATILFIPFVSWVLNMYEGSILQKRNELGLDEDERSVILFESINIGINHLFTGVGPLNTQMFTTGNHMAHNSFAQIFADTGVIGLLLFTKLVWSFLITQWKRFKETKDNIFLAFLVFGLIWFFDQMFYVFYHVTWLIFYFILVSSHSDSYHKDNYDII